MDVHQNQMKANTKKFSITDTNVLFDFSIVQYDFIGSTLKLRFLSDHYLCFQTDHGVCKIFQQLICTSILVLCTKAFLTKFRQIRKRLVFVGYFEIPRILNDRQLFDRQPLVFYRQPPGLHKNGSENSKDSQKNLYSAVFFNLKLHAGQYIFVYLFT